MGAVDLHARASKEFDAKLEQTRALLVRAATEFAPLTQASSLGAEDVVITHLINSLALDIPVFVLETGMLHPQTLELLERSRAKSRTRIDVYRPVHEAVIQFVAREGTEPMYKSIELRKACCHIRKVEPRERALAGQRAWITGLRREQSTARADVPLIDTSGERIKLNPLADWSWGDVWQYIGVNAVDYNPLHDAFFPSIGCAPCTRAISLGEDFRAGRWWWEDEAAKECGLHVESAAVIPAQARSVIPAQAGNQSIPAPQSALDSRLRGNDEPGVTSSPPVISATAGI
ncbi:MAG: phosphoadenylyl-sulfate reductase [Ramlibacter sp.]